MKSKIDYSLTLISKAIEQYKDKIAVACSFGKDSMVTVDLCQRVKPDIKVFSIMTPYKFKETLKYKEDMTDLWNLNIKTFKASAGKPLLYYEINPDECCDYYKVAQAKKAILELGLNAWISGLRQDEGSTRKDVGEVQETGGLIKFNPIYQWSEADVWLYHVIRRIPVHPLYAKDYRSLGCEPCSKPNTETERGGRWQGTAKEGCECGIHTQNLKTLIKTRDSGKY